MDEKELAVWKGVCDSLREPIQNKRLWRNECASCTMNDHIEGTGCFLDYCRIDRTPTWIEDDTR